MSTLPRDPTATERQPPLVVPPRYERQYDEAVREFESAADELGVGRPSGAELRDLCGQVAALTAEVFPGQITIEVRGDPEIAGELHFTFEVTASGNVDEIVARNHDWHVALRRAVGKRADLFCLSIDVR